MTELVEVEQSDREAALRFIPANSISGCDRVGLLAGQYDEVEAVQAFARHRIAEREACAKVADAHKPMGYMSDREREYCQDHGQEIADRIRDRTPCTPSPTGVD